MLTCGTFVTKILKTLIEGFEKFLLSDKFPLALAIILFFATSLDFGMTYHVFIHYPDVFYEYEAGILAKQFIGTNQWWIWHIGNAISNTLILWLAYFFNPRNLKFKNINCRIRAVCFFFSLAILWGASGWLDRI